MQTIHQDLALHVIGIELRTTNEEAFQTIPLHWKRFTEEDVPGRIAGKQSGDVYAVYTHFQNAGRNNQGLYSLVLGVPVDAAAAVPQGLTRVTVPASPRAVFPVEKGRFDLVGAKWQEIWARGDLAKTFIADFERYRPTGEIDILIGIAKETAAA